MKGLTVPENELLNSQKINVHLFEVRNKEISTVHYFFVFMSCPLTCAMIFLCIENEK